MTKENKRRQYFDDVHQRYKDKYGHAASIIIEAGSLNWDLVSDENKKFVRQEMKRQEEQQIEQEVKKQGSSASGN
jgi:hypothetical protein